MLSIDVEGMFAGGDTETFVVLCAMIGLVGREQVDSSFAVLS